MERKRKSNVLSSVWLLLKMIFHHKSWYLYLQLLLQLFCGLLPIMTALVWQKILRVTEISEKTEAVDYYFSAMAIIGGLSTAYYYFTETFDTIIRNKISVDLQKEVHRQASKLPMDDYESDELADLIDRVGNIFCYGDAVGFIMTVFGIIQQTVSLISILITVYAFQPMLTVATLILVLPGGVKMALNKMKIDLDFKLSSKRREVNVLRKYLSERNYMKDVQLMSIENYLLDQWEGLSENIRTEENRINKRILVIRTVMDMLENSATVITYGMCIYFTLNKEIDIAVFGTVIILTTHFLKNSTHLINLISSVQGEALAVHSAIGYFDLQYEKRNESLHEIEQIELKNVAYKYPGCNFWAVKNINLNIKKGEIIVIVGENGSGKTTLSKLILGLINPSAGVLTSGNEKWKDVEYGSLYKFFSSVFQDYNRYAMTVKENIIISDSDIVSDEQWINKILNILGINFIHNGDKLSLDTELGVEYGGTDISGGQWQQLAIARAAYKEAQAIVLDEPSSALDPLREAEIFKTFKKLCKNKIGVIISHRLSICTLADKIVVMDKGEIVECGTLDNLLDQNGNFAKLYRTQQNMYK